MTIFYHNNTSMKKVIFSILFGTVIVTVAIVWKASQLPFVDKDGVSTQTNSSKSNSQNITILIGGDMMFDRYIRDLGNKKGYDSIFSGIVQLFHSADIVVANLEGPITSTSSRTLMPDGQTTKSFTFTFEPEVAGTLSRAGITMVSMANNHTNNFGKEGLDQTHDWLEKAYVEWFGDPNNISGTEKILCKNSICIAFVGYHEFHQGLPNILMDVKRLSEQGYPVIVFAHWGDEYATTSPARVKKEARQFVAAGATAIVGAHPHVVEDMEWVGEVPIIYSLGNLIFDQYFSDAVMTGNIAALTISKTENVTHIDRVRIYTTSSASLKGPQLVGEPIEFKR